MGDARRAACRSAVLQPVRGPVWGAATATVERAERPPAAGLSAVPGSALSRPALSRPTLSRAQLSPEQKQQQLRARQPPGRPRQPPRGGVQSHPWPPPAGAAAAVDPLPGQRQPRGAPQPADTSPQPGDEVIPEPPSQKIAN